MISEQFISNTPKPTNADIQTVTALATGSPPPAGSGGGMAVQYISSNDPYSVHVVGTGTITEYTALQIPAVWCAVNWLANNLAGLPTQVFQKQQTTRQRLHDHPLAWLLDEPNELVTGPVFWTQFWSDAVTCGNGFALIEFERNTPVALYNLPPDLVRVFRAGGRQWYAIETGEGKFTVVPSANILHVPGLGGSSGMTGYPVMRLLAGALNIAKSTQRYTEQFFRQGGLVGGVVETERTLTPEQLADLKQSLNSYSGVENHAKWMALPGGVTAKTLAVPPENAALAEVIQSNLGDVCRIMNVPPFVIHEYGRATWANISSQNTQAVQFSLLSWILKGEAEFGRKLLGKAERKAGVFVAMNVDALIRGDHAQQIESATKRCGGPLTSVNEERALLDMPAIEGGEIIRTPANSVPLGSQATEPSSPEPPTAATPARQAAQHALNLETFGPLLADAAQRVQTKTDKATTTARNKFATDPQGWVAWSNVFAAEQAKFGTSAVAPILATMKAGGTDLDADATAHRIGETYAARLRGHYSRLAKGDETTAPDLAAITRETIEKGTDETAA